MMGWLYAILALISIKRTAIRKIHLHRCIEDLNHKGRKVRGGRSFASLEIICLPGARGFRHLVTLP